MTAVAAGAAARRSRTPSFRYAEHKKAEAFYDADVFYYQGTGFIHEVERLLVGELRAYLGCRRGRDPR